MKRSVKMFFVLALVMLLAPALVFAGPSEKNFGIQAPQATGPSVRAADSTPLNPYSVGDRVRAVVNSPSGSDCILAGYMGTIVCYDETDASLPYLVNWDDDCGFPQSQHCGVSAQHGWWVAFDEVELASTPGPTPGGDCATFDPVTNVLTISDVTVPANPFAGAETHWQVVLKLAPQATPFDPVRFEIDSVQQLP